MNVSAPHLASHRPPVPSAGPCWCRNPLSPALLRWNRRLEDLARPHAVNETALADGLRDLERLGPAGHGPAYWLSAARLTELTLWCAGAYADHCEIAAAGDLLANPRRILIHDRTRQRILIKQRHCRLSDQMVRAGTGGRGPGGWMPGPDDLETVESPLLPYLEARLAVSGALQGWYLEHVRTRMRQVVDTAAFLAAWSLASMEDLHARLRHASPARRAFIESQFCRFDLRLFDILGRNLSGLPGALPRHILADPAASATHAPTDAVGLSIEERCTP